MGADEDSFVCPNCGTDIAIGARFCRECGANDESGWDEASDGSWSYDGIEDDFDYDEFISNEFPDHAAQSPQQSLRRAAVVVIVVLVCVSMVLLTIF